MTTYGQPRLFFPDQTEMTRIRRHWPRVGTSAARSTASSQPMSSGRSIQAIAQAPSSSRSRHTRLPGR